MTYPPLPERFVAAKIALWTSLTTANALITAGFISWAFASKEQADVGIIAAGLLSMFGVLLPIMCIAGLVSVEKHGSGMPAQAPRLKPWTKRLAWWIGMEFASGLFLFCTLIHLIVRLDRGSFKLFLGWLRA